MTPLLNFFSKNDVVSEQDTIHVVKDKPVAYSWAGPNKFYRHDKSFDTCFVPLIPLCGASKKENMVQEELVKVKEDILNSLVSHILREEKLICHHVDKKGWKNFDDFRLKRCTLEDMFIYFDTNDNNLIYESKISHKKLGSRYFYTYTYFGAAVLDVGCIEKLVKYE